MVPASAACWPLYLLLWLRWCPASAAIPLVDPVTEDMVGLSNGVIATDLPTHTPVPRLLRDTTDDLTDGGGDRYQIELYAQASTAGKHSRCSASDASIKVELPRKGQCLLTIEQALKLIGLPPVPIPTCLVSAGIEHDDGHDVGISIYSLDRGLNPHDKVTPLIKDVGGTADCGKCYSLDLPSVRGFTGTVAAKVTRSDGSCPFDAFGLCSPLHIQPGV
eukprot:COSAG01_NODE_18547_length_1069_cov_1.047423_1_plen_218_part_01